MMHTKGKKEQNVFGSRKNPKKFDRMGFPISKNCCLASKNKIWKNRSRCMSEFIVLKMERIKALNPSRRVEVCGETALLGADFPPKKNMLAKMVGRSWVPVRQANC